MSQRKTETYAESRERDNALRRTPEFRKKRNAHNAARRDDINAKQKQLRQERQDRPARRIWEDFFRVKIPRGYVIHHKDGDISNNDPHNLLCLSREEHPKLHIIKGDMDAFITNLGRSGERAGHVKLTRSQVETIRAERSIGVTTVDLAQRFGVCHSHISNIALGKSWTD